ncbi:hypothetical protein [Anseongella ginsenosidimutans]|nr:hypothetical protein [Anseongella ginsenosidimutans]
MAQHTTEEDRAKEQERTAPQKPPLFDTWKNMYLFVLALHALVIAALYFLTMNYQ